MKLRAILAVALFSAFAVVVGPVSAAGAYPVTVCATLSVSTTNPVEGTAITVTGSHFDPNATIRLELHTQVFNLASVTSSADGTFSTQVTLPAGVTGNHLIVAVGGNTTAGSNCPADPSQALDIQKAGAANGGNNNNAGNNGGNLSSTGVDVLGLIAIAALLVVVGTAFNRRRQGRQVYTGEH